MIDETNLFDAFGGTRRMASHLRMPSSTVNSWKAAGRIPATTQPAVLAKAVEVEIDVTAEDVIFPLRARVREAISLGSEDHAADDTSQAQQSSCGKAAADSSVADQGLAVSPCEVVTVANEGETA